MLHDGNWGGPSSPYEWSVCPNTLMRSGSLVEIRWCTMNLGGTKAGVTGWRNPNPHCSPKNPVKSSGLVIVMRPRFPLGIAQSTASSTSVRRVHDFEHSNNSVGASRVPTERRWPAQLKRWCLGPPRWSARATDVAHASVEWIHGGAATETRQAVESDGGLREHGDDYGDT
jgi:hypothetical protein